MQTHTLKNSSQPGPGALIAVKNFSLCENGLKLRLGVKSSREISLRVRWQRIKSKWANCSPWMDTASSVCLSVKRQTNSFPVRHFLCRDFCLTKREGCVKFFLWLCGYFCHLICMSSGLIVVMLLSCFSTHAACGHINTQNQYYGICSLHCNIEMQVSVL
jgi:hypothetical protein